MEQANNLLNYLIRRGRLKKIKREGRVIATQSTTTERSQISVTQQYRWHMLVDTVWEDMRKKNKPADDFLKKAPYCQINLDETCFVCSEGSLKILGGGREATP